MNDIVLYFKNYPKRQRIAFSHILIILTLCVPLWDCSNAENDKQALKQKIDQINQKCPTLIDSETQLDGIELKGEHTIMYKYTLVHASVLAIDTHQFYLAMWPGILSTIRVSPEMQKLRDNEMTVYYKYRDAYNKEIYTFKITPRDYLILK